MPIELEGYWRQFKDRLRDRRFWVVQALVIGISAVHTFLEVRRTLTHQPDLYLLPVSTYFIPVVYAALNFGLEGAVPTAGWCFLLSLPNVFFFHHGAERFGVVIQLGILLAMGTVVAMRVDRERRAKQAAEAANEQLAATHRALETYVGMALRAQEEERHRLARELHDETIHDLLLVRAALEDLPQECDECPKLPALNDTLQRSIDGARRFCHALRPSVLDDLGLVPALEGIVAELGTRSNIEAALEMTGEAVRLNAESELAIFRIAQEALHNVERHAQAGKVVVTLAYARDGAHLKVVDDGRGFDPERLRPHCLGLTGMQERARLIGAALRISSRRGETQVALEVPGETEEMYSTQASETIPARRPA